MKRLILFLYIFLTLVFIYTTQSGCGSDTVLNPFTSNVTFAVFHERAPTGDTVWFKARPNLDVKIDSVVSVAPDNNRFPLHNNDTSRVFISNQDFYIDWFFNVQTGQQWTFYFYGRRADNNARYSASSPYTVP